MTRRNREIHQRRRTSVKSLSSSQRRTHSLSPPPLRKHCPPTALRGLGVPFLALAFRTPGVLS
uniref:Uncharacterized protein n=1 Tax=Amphimedon queenslandica TaxID=400682 RepID=A0A1X7UCY1_AMPQE